MATNIGGVLLGDLILGAETTSVISRAVTSTITFTQAIGHTQEALNQTITFSQSLSYSRVFNRTVTSNLTFSQVIKIIHPEVATSTLTLSQNIVYDKAKVQAVSQSTGFNQTLSGSHVASRLVVSGLNFSHTRDYDAVFTRPLSSSLVLSQTIHADKCTTASNTLVFGQTISYTKGKHVKHTLEWQQSLVNATSFVRPINTVLGLSQQIAKTGRFNKTVGQSLTLSQTIVQARVKGVSQTLNFSQTIVGYATRGVKNTLTFGQSVRVQMLYSREVISQLPVESNTLLNRSLSKEIHHGIGFNSIVKKWRINTRSLTDTFTPAQQIRFNVYKRTVAQMLALTQTVAYKPIYPRTVTSSLQFNQTVGLNRVIVESVSNNLTFLTTRPVYVGMGNVDYYNVDNLQYSLVPSHLVGKKNKPMCILQTKNGAITLPAPEFGDTENYGGVFTIRRSMNNIPYTHVRSLSLRKLHLPFVLAKRKAWELREFLIQHNPEVMTLTTWKGDKWFVNLTTNPLELRVSGRYDLEDEKVSVELEFEGLKVM